MHASRHFLADFFAHGRHGQFCTEIKEHHAENQQDSAKEKQQQNTGGKGRDGKT